MSGKDKYNDPNPKVWGDKNDGVGKELLTAAIQDTSEKGDNNIILEEIHSRGVDFDNIEVCCSYEDEDFEDEGDEISGYPNPNPKDIPDAEKFANLTESEKFEDIQESEADLAESEKFADIAESEKFADIAESEKFADIAESEKFADVEESEFSGLSEESKVSKRFGLRFGNDGPSPGVGESAAEKKVKFKKDLEEIESVDKADDKDAAAPAIKMSNPQKDDETSTVIVKKEVVPEICYVKQAAVDASKPASHETRTEESEDVYDKWDPMRSHYFTSQNFSSMDTSAPGSALLLENAPVVNMQLKDIPCKFHTGRDTTCWKDRCPYYHPIYGSKSYDMVNNEKVRRLPISYFSQLNAKDIAPKDSIIEVTVEHIKDPWKFFVSADADWECCCDDPKVDIPAEKVRRHKLEKMLTQELATGLKYMTLRFADYVEYQLVAVKRVLHGDVVFSRAVVLQTTVDITNFEAPTIPVQLLDYGAKMKVKFNEICHLPSKYVAIFPPLAYQCMLQGISPVAENWTPEGISYFKELVNGKKCLLRVMKAARWIQPDAPVRLFEDKKPYEVEIRIPITDPETGNVIYRSVAEMLAKEFHGIFWSACPYRPSLIQSIPRASLSFFGSTVHSPELLKELYERETHRKEVAEARESKNNTK